MAGLATTAVPLLAALASCAPSPCPPAPGSAERALRQATVSLGSFCAGVVVGPYEVLTAAHCIRATGRPIRVHYVTGASGEGEAVVVDRASDLAVLRLERRSPVRPLSIRATRPKVGDTVLFTGRNDYRHPFERAVVQRLGRCPSLPLVPQAIFTTLQAIPGDSGAPLVDGGLQVVGLVHGGARCHIAAPTDGAGALVAEARRAPLSRQPAAAHSVCRPRVTGPGSPRPR